MSSTTDRIRKMAEAAATAAINLARPNYFNSSEKGEIYELKKDLNNDNRIIKKEAVKHVIASMTIGKDVSNLFADVLKCMQTDDLELKKLVYLYLMNYAKSQPELVLLAVNTFCKDTEDPSPLIRALALRTMACIRIARIADYLCEPLHRTLQDESPYVRKTAVICVAKLFDLSPELVDENGFLDTLRSMLNDGNPMVVSSVVAALADIHSADPNIGALSIDERIAGKLITALPDCTEWGQVAILDALADYTPQSQEQLEYAIECIIPRLQHVNQSIVMSAIKVLIVYSGLLPTHHEHVELVKKKIAPALVSLLSAPHEIQWVALRSMRLILLQYPEILSQGIRVFFCKYNDPLYIKTEKLDLILMLASDENAEQVYPELADYAKEVDIEFVRRAIKAVGQLACKLPHTMHLAVDILIQLAKTEISYVTQEVLLVAREVLARYPESPFARVLPELYRDLSVYDEPESRAALLWLIGEHPEAFPDGFPTLRDILDNFKLEPPSVQSELFSSILKLYIRDPEATKPLILALIETGKTSFESAEFRDRAIFYERLVELDPRMLKSLSLDTVAMGSSHEMEPSVLKALLKEIGMLASVYHKLPSSFVTERYEEPEAPPSDSASVVEEEVPTAGQTIIQPAFRDLLGLDDALPTISPVHPAPTKSPSNLIDLLS